MDFARHLAAKVHPNLDVEKPPTVCSPHLIPASCLVAFQLVLEGTQNHHLPAFQATLPFLSLIPGNMRASSKSSYILSPKRVTQTFLETAASFDWRQNMKHKITLEISGDNLL